MSIWNHRSVAIVWALNLTYIEEFFSFTRVLRHFVLVPCEICVVPFGHRKIAADWNDIPLATSNTSLRSSRRRLDSIIVESIPPKILPIRSHFRRKLHLFDLSRRKARDKSGVASQSTSWLHQLVDTPRHKRICSSARRIAPSNAVAGQPGLRPARMHNYTDREKEPYQKVWFFFSNRQLSILPGRFQPSTFDV